MARVAYVSGWDHGKGGTLWQGISSHGAGIWVYGSCRHGIPDAGKPGGQEEDHTPDTVYVLFGQGCPFTFVFADMFFGKYAMIAAFPSMRWVFSWQ